MMMSDEGIYLDQLSVSELDKNVAGVAIDTPEEKKTVTLADHLKELKLNGVEASAIKKPRTPRRVLHFSDGTLEEYSTDEEDQTDQSAPLIVDTSAMSWGSWLSHQAYTKSSNALATCDYVGENIAYFLGITSPKYHYELEEHKRQLEEEERERREVAEQMVGWASSKSPPTDAAPTQQPASLPQTYLSEQSAPITPGPQSANTGEAQQSHSLPPDGVRY